MQQPTRIYFFLLVWHCIASLISCKSPEINDPVEYFRYVEDKKNGLLKEQKVSDYTFSLQYKPTDYMILLDNENLPIDRDDFGQEQKEYRKFQFYTLRIKFTDTTQNFDLLTYNLNSEAQYNERLHYLETDMQKDIRLICGGDTTQVSFFLFEKETTPDAYSSFLISFPASLQKDQDRTFVFDDHILKTGKISFTIEAGAIANTPALNL